MININQSYEHLAALALSVKGKTAPNPNVAAAIYGADGTLIADGVHNRLLSSDHAEVVAIKKAGEQARGATIVVSLEPCNHTGTTGPCVDAIINAGISTVIFAVADPNPVAAGGAERLKSAGIEVQLVESELLRDAQCAWLHRIEKGRPYFIWKIAATLDGRIAAADGTSQWITSEESRDDVQQLRSQSDAILIGTGTALADNPTLRPRIEGAPAPIRIVMGGRDVPKEFKLNDGKSQTIFLKSHSTDELFKALDYLPVNQVLVEAGSTLGSALLAAGAIDEIVLYQAPVILGAGKSWLEDIGITTISDSQRLALISSEQIGPDLKFRYRVEKN
ncbi:MAG: bifunctional diaminohydroxyphosphoribosylaminopyrimidine deaminase/5-amino-6-(5-phosphoribosylamino)uracil reductase RibD [Candidatus Planktophila sp.]